MYGNLCKYGHKNHIFTHKSYNIHIKALFLTTYIH